MYDDPVLLRVCVFDGRGLHPMKYAYPHVRKKSATLAWARCLEPLSRLLRVLLRVLLQHLFLLKNDRTT
jgi:hypothetical protein